MTDMPSEFTGARFYQYLAAHKLMGSRCQSCDTLYLPPRAMCPECYGTEMSWADVGKAGTLLAFTTVYIAPTAMLDAGYGRNDPYCVGIVQMDRGPAISGQIVGIDPKQPDRITIGARVRATFVTRGEGEKGRTFLAFEIA